MTYKGKKVGALATIVLALIVFFFIVRPDLPATAMKDLEEGSDVQELLDIAGKASYETDGTLGVERTRKKAQYQLVEECVRELWYESWISFMPDKYSFCYDQNNKLVHKYHWSSW